jgi:hypothetical protein
VGGDVVWVGVRYRGIALPSIMKVMRSWIDQRGYQLRHLDFVFSGGGTLVRAQFTQESEAAEFADAFAGFLSPDCPSIEEAPPDRHVPSKGRLAL